LPPPRGPRSRQTEAAGSCCRAASLLAAMFAPKLSIQQVQRAAPLPAADGEARCMMGVADLPAIAFDRVWVQARAVTAPAAAAAAEGNRGHGSPAPAAVSQADPPRVPPAAADAGGDGQPQHGSAFECSSPARGPPRRRPAAPIAADAARPAAARAPPQLL